MSGIIITEQPFWQEHYPYWLSAYYQATNHDRDSVSHITTVLRNLLSQHPGLWDDQTIRLLDMGIGDGTMAGKIGEVVAHYYPAPHMYGVEIQNLYAEKARQRLGVAATIVEGNCFQNDMTTLIPKHPPMHLVIFSNTAYFVPAPRDFFAHPTASDMISALSAFFENTMRGYFGDSTIGLFMHVRPVSEYVQQMCDSRGLVSRTVSSRSFEIRYPVLSDREWTMLENGEFKSTETVPEFQAKAQHMQRLIEGNVNFPLELLKAADRQYGLRGWRRFFESSSYRAQRIEDLTLVTLPNARPSIIKAVTG